jgi:hypothetical protein
VATIVCHSNCRADKTDLCLPEWVYEKIEAAGIRLQSWGIGRACLVASRRAALSSK